jgi:hypothetical protein
MGIERRSGGMRHVYLIGRYAIKIPRDDALTGGSEANREELRRWFAERDERLCPVLWGDPSGSILIMERAELLTDDGFRELDSLRLKEDVNSSPISGHRFYADDFKRENFGRLRGKIVRIDYGERPRN